MSLELYVVHISRIFVQIHVFEDIIKKIELK